MRKLILLLLSFCLFLVSFGTALAGTRGLPMAINAAGRYTPVATGQVEKLAGGWAVWPGIVLRVFTGDEPGVSPVYRYFNTVQGGYFFSLKASDAVPGDANWHRAPANMPYFYAKAPTDGQCPSGTVPIYEWNNDPTAYEGTEYRFVPGDSLWERKLSTAGWKEIGMAFCLPPQKSASLVPVPRATPQPSTTAFDVTTDHIRFHIGFDDTGNATGFVTSFLFRDLGPVCLWLIDSATGYWSPQCLAPDGNGDAVFTGTPAHGYLHGSVHVNTGGESWANIDLTDAPGQPLSKKVLPDGSQCLSWGE